MDVTGIYFGFTDSKEGLQQNRIHSILDKVVKDEHLGLVSYKLHVIDKLRRGYVPEKEENYSYYSSRKGNYTKPKTLYKLAGNVSYYYEINKTLYDFANYLIDNDLLIGNKLEEYIHNQQQIKAEKSKLEREERIKLQEKARLEEQDRKQRQQVIAKQQLMQGSRIIASREVDVMIYEEFNKHREALTKRGNQSFDTIMESLLQYYSRIFSSYGTLKSRVSYILFDYKVEDYINPRNDMEATLYTRLFKIQDTDSKQTVTAKVKAWYHNRVYTGGSSKPKELEEFYYYDTKDTCFKHAVGEKKSIEGLTCFILEKEDGTYSIIEAETGVALLSGKTNKVKAIQETKDKVSRNINIVKSNINKFKSTRGVSPLYREGN